MPAPRQCLRLNVMVLDGPLAFSLLLSYAWRNAVVPKWSRLNFTKWQLGAASGACWSADGWLISLTVRNSSFGLKRHSPFDAMIPMSGSGPKPCGSAMQAIRSYMSGRCGTKSRQGSRSSDAPRSSRREAPFVKQHKTLKGIMPAMAAGVRQALQPVFILRSRNRPSYRRTREIPRR